MQQSHWVILPVTKYWYVPLIKHRVHHCPHWHTLLNLCGSVCLYEVFFSRVTGCMQGQDLGMWSKNHLPQRVCVQLMHVAECKFALHLKLERHSVERIPPPG